MHAAMDPLAWLKEFCLSTAGALSSPISYSTKPTHVPLVHLVTIQFSEPLTGKAFLLVWNLLQQWTSKNNCALEGKVEKEGFKMTVKLVTKHRFGLRQINHPLGDKK
jgi:hypothetical protein